MSSRQEKAKIHQHPTETKEAALRMMREGYNSTEISRALSVNIKTVTGWAAKAGIKFKDPNSLQGRPPRKGMSGVIAPPAYRRGYRWSLNRIGRNGGWWA